MLKLLFKQVETEDSKRYRHKYLLISQKKKQIDVSSRVWSGKGRGTHVFDDKVQISVFCKKKDAFIGPKFMRPIEFCELSFWERPF